ncbi:MAG: tRNA (adenosine(37)-N6)-dimethylallyltransferase MiaA [Ruminococcaceae bacterium]|nr:tRNA (adenosine(37)-N6)-dimethylallyltransferase MiaA [Oscillospiraceae bacterium]
MPTNKPKILAVVGSTASGKTALSIALAEALGGEIISCDSMQLYRRMNIGTAKPTAEEMRGIPHHLIDIADPADGKTATYSCADYVKDAGVAVSDVLSRSRLPIFCGGTGLYLDAFIRGGSFEETVTDEALRGELAEFAQRNGNEALHARLRGVDAESAAAIHPNNVKRVIRALEIFMTTGKPKSLLDRQSREAESEYDFTVIGLKYSSRSTLYDRIDRRVDQMISDGLVEETKQLRALGVFDTCPTAAQAIGYKELFPHLDGNATLDEAVTELKAATRRYAKRQITWFSARPYVQWIDADDGESMREFEDIVNNAKKLFQE